MVAVAGMKVEALVLGRRIVHTMTGWQGTKYFNLQNKKNVSISVLHFTKFT